MSDSKDRIHGLVIWEVPPNGGEKKLIYENGIVPKRSMQWKMYPNWSSAALNGISGNFSYRAHPSSQWGPPFILAIVGEFCWTDVSRLQRTYLADCRYKKILHSHPCFYNTPRVQKYVRIKQVTSTAWIVRSIRGNVPSPMERRQIKFKCHLRLSCYGPSCD